jgi:hypothetical protein
MPDMTMEPDCTCNTCEIAACGAGRRSPCRASGVDTARGFSVRCPAIQRLADGGRPPRAAADLVDGYRLAAMAVDIETGQLARRTRRISDRLRLRRRLWRRRSRAVKRGPNAATPLPVA